MVNFSQLVQPPFLCLIKNPFGDSPASSNKGALYVNTGVNIQDTYDLSTSFLLTAQHSGLLLLELLSDH